MEKILVTIGHPSCKNPILPFCDVFVSKDSTEIIEAKKLRKKVADDIVKYGFVEGTVFKPSELYWAIFDDNLDKSPRLHSDNYFWGVNGYELQGKNPDGIPYYDVGYFHAKNGMYEPPQTPFSYSEYMKGWNDYDGVSCLVNLP